MNSSSIYFVRRSGGLFVLSTRPDAHRKRRQNRQYPSHPKPWQLRLVRNRLTDSLAERMPGCRRIWLAWQRLGQATLSEQTYRDLRQVLENSAPVACRRTDIPPRLSGKVGHDIRPWLVDPAAVKFLLEHFETLPRERFDPYFEKNHGCRWLECTPEIAEMLLPLVRGADQKQIDRLAKAWSRFEEREREVRGFLQVLLSLATPEAGISWLEVLGGLPWNDREAFLRWVIRERAFENRAPRDLPVILKRVEAIASQTAKTGGMDTLDPVRLQSALLRTIAAGVDVHYFLTGLEIDFRLNHPHLRRWNDWRPVRTTRKGRIFVPWLTIEQTARRANDPWLARALWYLCGRLKGIDRFILQVHRSMVPAEAAAELLRFPQGFTEDEATWEQASRCLPRLIQVLEGDVGADYVSKFLDIISVAMRRIKADDFESIESLWDLALRLSRPPFSKKDLEWEFVEAFLALPERARQRFAQAPDAAFKRFDEACRSEYVATPVCLGLRRLAESWPWFATLSFVQLPKILFRVCRRLGMLDWVSIQRIFDICEQHPLWTLRVTKLSDRNLAILLESVWDGKPPHPVSKAMRAHLEGKKPLEGPRYEHHRLELLKQVTRLRLDVMEGVIESLVTSQSPRPGLNFHTVAMVRQSDKNRRQLGDFLRSWKRSVNSPDEHPKNQAWLARHLNRNRKLWTRGWKTRMKVGSRTLVFDFEQDPEEILRIGTYVGSCVGLGSCNSFAPSAVLLDANKRVIFARTLEGKFVARQIVVISRENRLAFCSVYPLNIYDTVQRAFARYDIELANRLRLPIREDGDNDEIELLVAREWYWDGQIDPRDALKTGPTA